MNRRGGRRHDCASRSSCCGETRLYVSVQSLDRVAKERAIRRRQLKRLWAQLKQRWTMLLTCEELLMKPGAARNRSRKAWRVVVVEVAAVSATFSYCLYREELRQAIARRRVALTQ
jgi:hypothetical protein